jgi:hypothetical protein
MIWFDYLVLTGDDPLGAELDGHRRRDQRVNAEDPEPPLGIFKRLTGHRYLREAGVAAPVGSPPSR